MHVNFQLVHLSAT